MKTITFSEKLGDILGKHFTQVEDNQSLLTFMVTGMPIAIAATLAERLKKNKTTSESISFGDIATFKLDAIKSGDSVAFVPEFTLGKKGLEWVNMDDLSSVKDDKDGLIPKSIDSASFEFSNANPDFGEFANKAFQSMTFRDGTWVHNGPKDVKGVDVVPADTAYISFIILFTLIDILVQVKDETKDCEYEIEGFGKFTIKPGKDGYTISCDFDKEFKAAAKSDELAEMVRTMED